LRTPNKQEQKSQVYHKQVKKAEFISASDNNLSEIFPEIKAELGLIERTQALGMSVDNLDLVAVQKEYHPYLIV